MHRKKPDRVRETLLEFFHGVRRIEALRRDAGADELRLEKYAGLLAFGLRKTEEVLREEGLLAGEHVTSPSSGEYLH